MNASTRRDVDAALVRLAEIRRHLSDLPADAFAERAALRRERFQIQEQIGPIDLDGGRSTEDLLDELSSQRARLHHLEGMRMNVAAQQGGGGESSGWDGWGAMQLNLTLDEANDVAGVEARIGRLKSILAERGVDDPAAVPQTTRPQWIVLAAILAVVGAALWWFLRPISFPVAAADLSWTGTSLENALDTTSVVTVGETLFAGGSMMTGSGGEGAVVWSSSDGSAWVPVALPNGRGGTVNSVVAYGRQVMAVGVDSDGIPIVWISPDGAQWIETGYHEPLSVTDRSVLTMTAATPLERGVVVVGSDRVSGDDSAAVWYMPSVPAAAADSDAILSQVTRNHAVFGGEGDQVMLGVAASGEGVIAVGSDDSAGDVDGAVWYSTDGRTDWRRIDGAVFGGAGDQVVSAVTWFSSGAVAVGSDGSDAAAWYSTDGVSWSRVADTAGVFDGARMVGITSYGKGVVAVGQDGSGPVAWYSADGRSWVRDPFAGDPASAVIQFGRELVAVGGTDVWIGK